MRQVIGSQSPSLNVLSQEPLVAGTPMSLLDGQVVPTNLFFIRNHFPVPALDADQWSLKVTGKVRGEFSLTYPELKEMPRTELEALLECAGNSRAAIQPPIEGLLWDHSGVSSANWAGVSLRTLLDRAGLLPSAQEVLLIGADRGTEAGESAEMCFAMSLPMDKALDPSTLLAYEMNGQPLQPQHGYPLRLVMPGWYGMASIKWLDRIEAIGAPFDGYQQAQAYRYSQTADEPGEPVTLINVRALMIPPGIPDFLTRTRLVEAGPVLLRGRAWAGRSRVSRVEVSVDDGATWSDAQLGEEISPYAWRGWSFEWQARPGTHTLSVRATDSEGNLQSADQRWNFQGMGNNMAQRVAVVVE